MLTIVSVAAPFFILVCSTLIVVSVVFVIVAILKKLKAVDVVQQQRYDRAVCMFLVLGVAALIGLLAILSLWKYVIVQDQLSQIDEWPQVPDVVDTTVTKVNVDVGEPQAWSEGTSEDSSTYFEIPVTITNESGIDFKDISVTGVDIMKGVDVYAYTQARTRVDSHCGMVRSADEPWMPTIDLPNGCQHKLTILDDSYLIPLSFDGVVELQFSVRIVTIDGRVMLIRDLLTEPVAVTKR
jgi:hypothetical protein